MMLSIYNDSKELLWCNGSLLECPWHRVEFEPCCREVVFATFQFISVPLTGGPHTATDGNVLEIQAVRLICIIFFSLYMNLYAGLCIKSVINSRKIC